MYIYIYVHAYMLGNGWIWKEIHPPYSYNIYIYSCYERDVQVWKVWFWLEYDEMVEVLFMAGFEWCWHALTVKMLHLKYWQYKRRVNETLVGKILVYDVYGISTTESTALNCSFWILYGSNTPLFQSHQRVLLRQPCVFYHWKLWVIAFLPFSAWSPHHFI